MPYPKPWKESSLYKAFWTNSKWPRLSLSSAHASRVRPHWPASRVTSSQRAALEHLKLDSLTIVGPGSASYPLEDKIHVRGLGYFIEPQGTSK